jgi:hypothetical protein
MADNDQTPNQTSGEIPPKQVPFKVPESPAPAPAPETPGQPPPTVLRRPVLRRPGEAPPVIPPAGGATVARGIPISPGTAAKKQTSRIDLPAGEMRPAGNVEIKTVKVKPVSMPTPGGDPLPDGPKPLSEAQVHAAKSKTSRISLEAALGAVADVPAAGTPPKTIRLKRPSDLPPGASRTGAMAPGMTAHIGGAASTATAPIPSLAGAPSANVTAHLPTSRVATQHIEATESAETASMTRRKTIKVKRPGSARVFKVQRPEGAEGGAAEGEEGELQTLAHTGAGVAAVGPDTAHWFFVTAAVLAIVATIGLAWILASQTFGPNAAVTGFTKAYGPDLPSPIPGTVLN